METRPAARLLLMTYAVTSLAGLSQAVLFSYGSGATLHRNDDGFSSQISISTTFNYFGNPQSQLYVCTNGIISFGSGISSYTPTPFPIANNPVVAPFWGDVDIRSSGTIYYREVSGSDLNQLTTAVDLNGFTATWGYIVTWVAVPAYPGSGSATNTFQAALCTDGTFSFVIYNYQQLQWTYGSASGGVSAQVGFDAGDRTLSYAHEWSRTSDITGLVSSSNVGVTGRFIYGVGEATIQPVDEVVVVDPCEGVNCNHGTCSDGTCTCNHGYEGTYCDTVTDNCASNPCENGGTCVNAVGSYRCDCSLGYEGTHCETVIMWCERQGIDCNGHGTCSNTNDNTGWQCACDCGYNGDQCDGRVCLGNYCYHLGTCGEDGCECVSPYSGSDCSVNNAACTGVDCGHGECSGAGVCTCDDGYSQASSTAPCDRAVCGSSVCYNGGSCVDGACQCTFGWSGSECTIQDNCRGFTCNGHGQCIEYNGNAICRCDDSSFSPESGELNLQCSQHTCGNGVVCNNGGVCNSAGGCDCVYPYMGDTCDTTDYCNGGEGIDCAHGSCSTTSDGFACECPSDNNWADPVTAICTSTICSCDHECRNGGTCNGNVCSCAGGYSGTYCEIIDPCYSVTCENGGSCHNNRHNDGDYICACADGFHGRHCELQRCTNSVTCYNEGRCTPDGCDCPEAWTGSYCTTEVPDVCQGYDCGDGGTCSGTSSAVCTCQGGYSQTSGADPCTLTCGDLQCTNGGVCSDDQTYCLCQPGWYGRAACDIEDPCADVACHASRGNCETYDGVSTCACVLDTYSSDDCATEACANGWPQTQCQNGGSCSAVDGCLCPYPYEGDQCETTNYCPDGYCVHGTCSVQGEGAVCSCDEGYIVDRYTGLCTSLYTCRDGYTFCMHDGTCNAAGTGCQCVGDYTGTNCETLDLCAGHSCDHGLCVAHEDSVTSSCACEPGWMGELCDMQACHGDNVCQNGASCSIDGCICSPGWTGDDCTTQLDDNCYDVTENYDCGQGSCVTGGVCSCDSGYSVAVDGRCTAVSCGDVTCQNGASCVDGSCVCARGYHGSNCSDADCQGLDCGEHGHCHLMDDGSNQCICDDPRWSGHDCSIETCSSESTCQNGGSCVNGGQPCACVPGYSGDDCGTPDTCSGVDCLNGGVCNDVAGEVVCRCADGFLSDPLTGLCSIQQCLHHTCMNNQSCGGADTCDCQPPYSGTHCQQVDYCYGRSCSDRGTCREAVDASGSSLHVYECVCDDGFHADDCQYQFCTDDVVCFNGGRCTATYGCDCAEGYGGPSCEIVYTGDCLTLDCVHGQCQDSGETVTCECIDSQWGGDDCNTHSCSDGSRSCQNGGTCVDGSAGDDVTTALFPDSVCFCAPGFTGENCEEVDPCTGMDCHLHGRCLVIDGVAQCVCDDDRWTGASCEDERCSASLTCQNGGSCLDDGTCACTAEYSGSTCGTLDTCGSEPCDHGDCAEVSDGFECTCHGGYTLGITGICDTMWCTTDETFCMNGGTCVSHDTYSTCLCPPGVTGTNCETVDHCFNQDCNGHGRCENRVEEGDYTCHCTQGWIGQDCSMQRCLDATCMNNGVCGYDGCRCTSGWTGATCEERVEIGCQGVECGHGSCVVDYTGIDTEAADYVQGCAAVTLTLVSANNGTAVLSASSEADGMGASSGTLNSGSGWSPSNADGDQWISVEFQDEIVVSAVTTVGGESGFVTGYHVSYSTDGSEWSWIREAVDSSYRVFSGNDDSDTPVTRDLVTPVIARYVRLHPVTWVSDIQLAFDVSGCVYEQTGTCSCDATYSTDAAGACTTVVCDVTFSCHNGGSCIEHFYDGEPACLCPPGFHGRDCSVSLCDGFDCHGNGRCEVLYDGTAACVCDHGRWSHEEELGEGGYCAQEECSEELTCRNGGHCVPRPVDETTVCECPYPYTGDTCETPSTCGVNPCANGTCHDDFIYDTQSHCECDDGFVHDADTQLCTTQLCADGRAFCMHGGTCNAQGDGCTCPDGVTGDYCQTVDYCHGHSDCSGHGTCINMPDEQTFYCACDDGWIGTYCDRQRCDDFNTCMNGAYCQADGWNQGCQCPEPLYDDMCESSDYCQHADCVNGTCVQDTEGYDYVCDCEADYEQTERTAACDNLVATCSLPEGGESGGSVVERCQYGGVCTSVLASVDTFDPVWENETGSGEWIEIPDIHYYNVTCTCPSDRLGDQCEIYNECADDEADPCSGHGTCVPRADGTVECTCHDGFEGPRCDVHICPDGVTRCNNSGLCNDLNVCTCAYPYVGDTCVELNSCAYVDCYNGTCSQDGQGFTCLCQEGFIVNRDTGECTTQLCRDVSDTFCMNHGVCDEPNGCICHEEWIDHNCETYNWCWNQTCSGRGRCDNEEFDYSCVCYDGFYGRNCELQVCYEGVICRNLSVCSNTTCQCQEGYTGAECDVIDPCLDVDCGPGGECVNDNRLENPRQEPIYWTADYLCEATSDAWAQSDPLDPHSPWDVAICAQEAEYNCSNSGTCRRRRGVYSCICEDGWIGPDCATPEPCTEDACSGHGTCHVNADYTANCTCDDNYLGDDCSIHNCTAFGTMCYNGGRCPLMEDLWCLCPSPYTGATCEDMGDSCFNVDCGNGTCDPTTGECQCEDGFITNYFTGACTTHVCEGSRMLCMNGGTCSDNTCTCPDWYNYNEMDPTADLMCEHWNHCFDQTCSGHGTCINHDDGYTCECDVGWRGSDCDRQECIEGVTCMNGGVCTPGGCECLQGYSGDDCRTVEVCGQVNCGTGQCVQQPTVEEGCLMGTNSSWMSGDNAALVMSASSEYTGVSAADGAAYGSGWAPADDDTSPYIEADLGREVLVESVSTWGRGGEWVTTYKLAYSVDGTSWSYVINPLDYYGGDMIYTANSNGVDEAVNAIEPHIVARFVRIHPQQYQDRAGIRFDVTGCAYYSNGYTCDCSQPSRPGTWTHEGDETSPCSVNICSHVFSTGDNAGQNATCSNYGVCHDTFDENDWSSFCECSDGYTGPFCDIEDLCYPDDTACHGRGSTCDVTVSEFDAASGTYSHNFSCACADSGSDVIVYSGDMCDESTCNDTLTCVDGTTCSDDMESCVEPGPCDDVDCRHGECNVTAQGFTCVCTPGEPWIVNTDTGLCTTRVCDNGRDFCMNEGQCTDDMDDPQVRGTCQCRNYDIGENCEIVNQCGPENDCYGRGECNERTGVCECDRGYSGTDCGTEVCRNGNACYNGGSCNGRGRSCDCLYPYLDDGRCEELNWCVGSASRANRDVNCYAGTCNSHDDGWLPPNTNVTGGYNCTCDQDWEIDGAETEDDYIHHCTTAVCEDGSLCHNRGRCRFRRGRWKCKCRSGYRGRDCSRVRSSNTNAQQQEQQDGSGTTAAALGATAGIVAAAGAVAGAGFLIAARRRKKKKEEEEEMTVEDLENENDRTANSTAPNTHQGVKFRS